MLVIKTLARVVLDFCGLLTEVVQILIWLVEDLYGFLKDCLIESAAFIEWTYTRRPYPYAIHTFSNRSPYCMACKQCGIEKPNSLCSCCIDKMADSNYNHDRKWRRDCPFCGKQVGILSNWVAIFFGTRVHKCDFSKAWLEFEVWNKLNS